MPKTPLLRATGLCKDFVSGDTVVHALQNVCFDIQESDRVLAEAESEEVFDGMKVHI